jgi:hypothetical protein
MGVELHLADNRCDPPDHFKSFMSLPNNPAYGAHQGVFSYRFQKFSEANSFRHFMADQVKKLFRNVPRELRSLWMGHVVRDGSRTTTNYESDDPVALATDCVIALVQEHCRRRLFAVDVLLTKAKLQAIGARAIPKMKKNHGFNGGRDRDRTCDPYHVKVVLYR